MNRLIERCAMLDIHKSQITACVRVPDEAGGRRQEIREFAATTLGLLTLADWLRSFAVTVVGMESTGVYWRPVFYLLEGEFECQLFNARHLRHVHASASGDWLLPRGRITLTPEGMGAHQATCDPRRARTSGLRSPSHTTASPGRSGRPQLPSAWHSNRQHGRLRTSAPRA